MNFNELGLPDFSTSLLNRDGSPYVTYHFSRKTLFNVFARPCLAAPTLTSQCQQPCLPPSWLPWEWFVHTQRLLVGMTRLTWGETLHGCCKDCHCSSVAKVMISYTWSHGLSSQFIRGSCKIGSIPSVSHFPVILNKEMHAR